MHSDFWLTLYIARQHLDIFNLNNRRPYWFYIINRNHDRALSRKPGFWSRTRYYSKLSSCHETTLYAQLYSQLYVQLLCLCLTPNLLCSIKSNIHFVNYYIALLSLIITTKRGATNLYFSSNVCFNLHFFLFEAAKQNTGSVKKIKIPSLTIYNGVVNFQTHHRTLYTK